MRELSRCTLRITKSLQQKINYTASFNSRSQNKEIETAIKRYLNDFERLHGEIDTKKEQDF